MTFFAGLKYHKQGFIATINSFPHGNDDLMTVLKNETGDQYLRTANGGGDELPKVRERNIQAGKVLPILHI